MDALTPEARSKIVADAVAAADASGERHDIEWKGGTLTLPVVEVPVSAVLLNASSHRIRSQLESMGQAAAEVRNDPYSESSQALVAQLLEETEGFEAIRRAIEHDGQRDPGVLTSGGVLINANTRAVALRKLRRDYIKVQVLPADAGPKEITDIELSLQMQQEVKQDYTFTNRLLFIEDLLSAGRTAEEVGRALDRGLTNSRGDLRKAKETVETEMRLLNLIRQVIQASGGTIPLTYFDDKRQALIEIDADYERLRTSEPDKARRVRDAQLLGMNVGVDYRKLRQVDDELLSTYVVPAMTDERDLKPYVNVLTTEGSVTSDAPTPKGVDVLDDDDAETTTSTDTPVRSLQPAYQLLMSAPKDGEVTLPSADGEPRTMSRNAFAAVVGRSLMNAITVKQRDAQQGDRLVAPVTSLKEAARLIDRARAGHGEVASSPEFPHDDFQDALAAVQRAMDDLNGELEQDPQ